jgi:hypothetical protein
VRRLGQCLVLGVLVACTSPPPFEKPSTDSAATESVEPPQHSGSPEAEHHSFVPKEIPGAGRAAAAGTPARLKLRPVGLTPIYSGYFQNSELTQVLAADLGAFWPGMNVMVECSWESMAEGGALSLFVPLGEGRTPGLSSSLRGGQPIGVESIARLMAPLGSFRAALGARFDLRFLGFALRVVFHDPRSGRSCVATGAPGDPSGREVGACFECSSPRGAVQLCRAGEVWPASLIGPADALDQLAAALE